ncbi:MAG: SDR family NAD(P)-dependent oxidoreductase [Rhodothalassiaceae bacterium]
MRLKDRVALITGAGRGIGRACAEALHAEGAQIIATDIDAEAAEQTAAALGGIAFTLDVADPAACRAVVQKVERRFGRVDVLVNNAGIVAKGDILSLRLEDFDHVLSVNLRGALAMTQAVAWGMADRGQGGAIVNISSVNAQVAIPDQLAYCVSKGGLQQLTKASALALAPHRIRVNAIAPGSIMTDMLGAVNQDAAAKRKLLARTPLGRIGDAGEIGQIAVFLASDQSSYVTGETILADGGRLALNYTVPVPE